MAELVDIRAFLVTARLGSFSAAGRELGLAPSVMTKRVGRLEEQMGGRLFLRSTRSLTLTALGERVRPRLQLLLGEIDEVFKGAGPPDGTVEGNLRIKMPTVTAQFLGALLADFQVANPRLTLDIHMVDRSVNPLEEGFDVSIGALPASYVNVIDEPLCPYRRILCAAPAYLEARGRPVHPTDLIEHDCLTYLVTGNTWTFDSPQGPMNVEVHPKFNVNDSRVLLTAARRGLGLATLPVFLCQEDLAAGRLVAQMQDYPVSTLWLKALVPRIKRNRPAVRALVEHLQRHMGPIPPWENGALTG
ncbi:LysR family transcriptional regulator [Oceanicella sp. SM1341]|uniref:LysR family transcriptional regulator n=1 Tax=Oceanicella sp. SM1341 TaxID=1548889 RepID=UPI000E5242A7|nr:LysR family transcriptional regulator [Oceanicella sp. SM1341]